ncbi:nuclear transport factor 2 family protein [Collimonas sp. NPDC087041]|uniref:nuclear transport factor 2 family protein n=1 Tax=Collimonas sp. NPDC087041 TaxID=3363960 RepID=UPI0037F91AA3
MATSTIERWHEIVKSRDIIALKALLADDVLFESPVVHTPQNGSAITAKYLAAALHVLNNDSFQYVNEWLGPHSAVLEFETSCEGILINGVDIITWNDQDLITRFKVMIRPLKAVNKIHEMMGRMLQQDAGQSR